MNVHDFVNMAAGGVIGGPIKESTPWNMTNRKRDVKQANSSRSSTEGDPKNARQVSDFDGSYIDIVQGNLEANTMASNMQDLGLVPPVHLKTPIAPLPNTTVIGAGQLGDMQYTLPSATLTNMTGHPIAANRINMIPNYRPQQPIVLNPSEIPSFHFEPFEPSTEPELDSSIINAPAVQALKSWFKQELTAQMTEAMGNYMVLFTNRLMETINRELAVCDQMIDKLIGIGNANGRIRLVNSRQLLNFPTGLTAPAE